MYWAAILVTVASRKQVRPHRAASQLVVMLLRACSAPLEQNQSRGNLIPYLDGFLMIPKSRLGNCALVLSTDTILIAPNPRAASADSSTKKPTYPGRIADKRDSDQTGYWPCHHTRLVTGMTSNMIIYQQVRRSSHPSSRSWQNILAVTASWKTNKVCIRIWTHLGARERRLDPLLEWMPTWKKWRYNEHLNNIY